MIETHPIDATALPRMPYGIAKQIVQTLREGEAVNVRPAWRGPIYNAARRLGLALTSVGIERDGELLFRMMLRIEGGVSGHQLSRPANDPTTGRWQAGKAVA